MISVIPLYIAGLTAAISLISFYCSYPNALKKMSVLWISDLFLVDLAGHVTKSLGIKNHWIYNFYFWIFYLGLAYLYRQQIQNKYVRLSILYFYFAFALQIVWAVFTKGITTLNTTGIVIGGTFMIFLSAAYFRQLYLSEENERLTLDPWFWFSFGFLIYFGGTMPFLGMLNYLLGRYPVFSNFYYSYVSNSFAILMNLLVITGFLCRRDYRFRK